MSLANSLLHQIERIGTITTLDIYQGQTIDSLIRHTMDEMGEFCQAVTSEIGEKPRQLKESSTWEAGDLTICALALFFARGGTPELLLEIFQKKLDKWELYQRRKMEPTG